jgi:hypothetical protein
VNTGTGTDLALDDRQQSIVFSEFLSATTKIL